MDIVVGTIVHYTLPENREVRPAIIIRTWGRSEPYPVQLAVFVDGTNDIRGGDPNNPPLLKWRTSVTYDESGRPGTWKWIE
jgi:hypothetical protein